MPAWADWDEICHDDANWASQHICKKLVFKKQDGGRPPFWEQINRHNTRTVWLVITKFASGRIYWPSTLWVVEVWIFGKLQMADNWQFRNPKIAASQQRFDRSPYDEWMNLFAWHTNNISQAGTPWHDNCVHLPVSWATIRHRPTQLRVSD